MDANMRLICQTPTAFKTICKSESNRLGSCRRLPPQGPPQPADNRRKNTNFLVENDFVEQKSVKKRKLRVLSKSTAEMLGQIFQMRDLENSEKSVQQNMNITYQRECQAWNSSNSDKSGNEVDFSDQKYGPWESQWLTYVEKLSRENLNTGSSWSIIVNNYNTLLKEKMGQACIDN
uniref:Uncharacterized protein n=1 Tax=Romanomermis culicivorax TaxID=13658 RepID=A0A915KE93_ROMCU